MSTVQSLMVKIIGDLGLRTRLARRATIVSAPENSTFWRRIRVFSSQNPGSHQARSSPIGDQSPVIDRPCRPDSLRLSPVVPRMVDAVRQFVSRGERMSPGLDKLRSAGLIGATAALLALVVLERASAQQQGAVTAPAAAAVPAEPIDRAKVLTAPNVFGVFATYKVHPDFYRMGDAERNGAAAEVLAVVDKHKAKVVVDAYLTRGLGAGSDCFLRVHAYDLAAAQGFLNAFRATRFGRFAEVGENLVGITRPAQLRHQGQVARAECGLVSRRPTRARRRATQSWFRSGRAPSGGTCPTPSASS